MKKLSKNIVFINFSTIFNSERKLLLFSLGFILLLFAPYILLGENFYLAFSYDSLDSNVVWWKILLKEHAAFADNSKTIEQALGGLARVSYPMEFNIEFLLYFLFKPHVAYVVNILLVQVFAFIGMVLLLGKLYPDDRVYIRYLVAIAYSCLPFWPHAGISIGGLPLLIYAYLISKEKIFTAILIMVFYVLYSSLILSGIFLIAILVCYQFYQWFVNQERNKKQLVFVAMLLFLSVIFNYRYFLFAIKPSFISQRFDYVSTAYTLKETLAHFMSMILGEYGHNLKRPELIVSIVVFWLMIKFYKRKRITNDIKISILLILTIAFISVIMQFKPFVVLKDVYFPFLKAIQLQRFYWLLPPIFYILFYQIIRQLINSKLWLMLGVGVLILQIGFVACKNKNYRQLIKTEIFHQDSKALTWASFYSEELYTQIDKYIGKEKSLYRIASLGLQPAAALYHGFYTIDGYFGNYPIKYKEKLFNIMQIELQRDSIAFKRYKNEGIPVLISTEIDGFLNRNYVIPVLHKYSDSNVIERLDYNSKVLKELNCQYVFSAVKIMNNKELQWSFERLFTCDNSPYEIYLYSIN